MENLIDLTTDPSSILGKTKIFVNGCWVGVHSNAHGIIVILKAMRRRGDIPYEVIIIIIYIYINI